MYLTGPAHLWAAYCHPSGCGSRGYVDEQITNVVLRIRREGQVVTSEFDAGEGFMTLRVAGRAGFRSRDLRHQCDDFFRTPDLLADRSWKALPDPVRSKD